MPQKKSEVFEVSLKIKRVVEVLILRAQPQIAICILISAALTKSTHSTPAWGCLRTIMHDNIKVFLYCLSSSFAPSAAPLNRYLQLKAVVTTANTNFGACTNTENLNCLLSMVSNDGRVQGWFYPCRGVSCEATRESVASKTPPILSTHPW